jgi:integrase
VSEAAYYRSIFDYRGGLLARLKDKSGRQVGQKQFRLEPVQGVRATKRERDRVEAEASAWLDELVAHLEREARGERFGERPETGDQLADIFEEWYSGSGVDPATSRKVSHQLRHYRRTFGKRDPSSISKAEVEDWHRGLSPGVKHDILRTTRQLYLWAVDPDRGLVDRDPTRGIRNSRRPRHERRPILIFESWSEVDAVATELDPRIAALPILMVGAMLRPEEALALHWGDIDLENRILHVRRRYSGGLVKSGSKTNETRPVPFGLKVLAALKQTPRRLGTEIVFPGFRDGGYFDLSAVRSRHWDAAVRAAGLEHRSPYACRHTGISWALTAGVPVAKVARIAGTSIAMIEQTYHHLLGADLEVYGTALDAIGVVS